MNGDLISLPTALSGHQNLTKLALESSGIGENGCAALASLFQNPACKIKDLNLAHNNITDEGLSRLAVVLARNNNTSEVLIDFIFII